MVPSDAVELRGSGSYLLIGRRLSFGQLSSRGHSMPGVVGDPHRLADLMRRYLQQSGNEGKLRAFWWRVAGGMNTPWRVQDLIAEVVRYVSAGHWLALEVQEEGRGAVSLEQERRQADIRPAVIGPCSGDIGSLSLEEKFSIAFRKVPDHLEEGFRDSFRNLISPAAIGFTVATTVAIAGLSVASGGTAVPVIIAIGYALVGWAIFNAVGDLIDTFLLVYNATDERDLDRAATKLASAAAELTVGVLITLLTRGAGRLGVGGKSRVRTNQTNEFETVPPSRERFEAPREAAPTRAAREAEALPKSVKKIRIAPKQIQKKFKHAADFGIPGHYNPDNAKKFEDAIEKHINAPGTKEIVGSYRGRDATFYLDEKTGLTVIQNPDGSFLSGWKLNKQQLHHVLTDSKL